MRTEQHWRTFSWGPIKTFLHNKEKRMEKENKQFVILNDKDNS